MKNQKNFFLKLILIALVQVMSLYFITSEIIAFQALGIILLGLINAHAIQVLHQCTHFLGLKNKRANDLVGRILGFPVFINFKAYRISHFQHHKKLGTYDDVEFFGFNNLKSGSTFLNVVPYLFGFSKYQVFFSNYKQNWKHLSLYLFISVSLVTFGYSVVLIAWACSLFLITEPVHFLIEIPEHYGCKKISLEKYENTRTIKSPSKFARWYTNWNNFHVEHHLYQWVLPEDLVTLHDIKRAEKHGPTFRNYTEFYVYFLKDIMKKESNV